MSRTLGLISAMYEPWGDFGPFLKKRTLATLPFGGRYRMIDFAISAFVNAGICSVGVIAPFYYRSLIDHIGAGKPWNLEKNTGGLFILPETVFGIKKNVSRFLIGDLVKNFRILRNYEADYVILSDTSYVGNIDIKAFIEAHEKNRCPVTIMYVKTNGNISSGSRMCLQIDETGRVTGLARETVNPNSYVGIIIMDRHYLIDIVKNYSQFENYDIFDVILMNIDRITVNSYENKEYVGIVESIEDYYQVSMDLLSKNTDALLFNSFERPIVTKRQDEVPTFYKAGAQVRNSIVASGCVIEGKVENSILFRSVHIAPGSVVENSILMQHTEIGRGSFISSVIADKYSTIRENKTLKGSSISPMVVEKGLNL